MRTKIKATTACTTKGNQKKLFQMIIPFWNRVHGSLPLMVSKQLHSTCAQECAQVFTVYCKNQVSAFTKLALFFLFVFLIVNNSVLFPPNEAFCHLNIVCLWEVSPCMHILRTKRLSSQQRVCFQTVKHLNYTWSKRLYLTSMSLETTCRHFDLMLQSSLAPTHILP